MVLVRLFFAFLKVGFFAIGGAYSFLPLIEKEAVEKYHWLSKEEFLDVLAMVQVFPGAISIKYATYTGYKIAGVIGAIAANIGNMLAPVLLIAFGSFFYAKYKNTPTIKSAFSVVQLAVFAMIIALAFQTINLNQLSHFRNIIVVVLSFILFVYVKVHPALIIICAGILGVFLK
ncbi:MAG: chromate transporter [Candidatus Omnitrophota bacterium]|nr:chromate transporter [Candidatus Omnitrophota bacterium]